MRGLLLCLLMLSPALPVLGAETAAEWLDIAADAKIDKRRREYAARQLVMLADHSASILIAAVRGDGRDSALRRQIAARLLAETAPPEAEDALLEAAFGDDYFLAEAAANALERLYSTLPDADLYSRLTRGAKERAGAPDGDDWLALSLALSRKRGVFKALVMRGLARKYVANATELPLPLTWQVWEGLLDPDPDLRLASVRMTPHVRRPESTERLAGFLYTENDPKILIAALRTMADMRPPDYGEAVERHAGHADPAVAIEALAAMDAMGYPNAMFPGAPGAKSVAGFVAHPSTPVRRRAIELIGASRNPAALEYLEAALFDRVGANRALAARALGDSGLTAAVGSLFPLLRDGRPEVRAEAAVALSRLGVVGIAAGMIDDLRTASPPFRIAAAGALGRIGDARAVPALLDAAEKGEGELRSAAVDALTLLDAREAGPGLMRLLRAAGDPVFADAVRRALATLYREDPGAEPAGWDAWSERNFK